MKKKEFKELLNLDPSELQKQIKSLYSDLGKIQIDRSINKLKNSNLRGQKIKEIARLKTVINLRVEEK